MLEDTGITIDFENLNFDLKEQKNRLNRPLGDFFYDPWVIEDAYKGTDLERILNSFPKDIGEARIIVLEPGQAYLSHADIDDRYHLNIAAQQSFLIDLENQIMHPVVNDNKVWKMDAGRIHTAANFGSYNRLQLVVRQLLKKNDLEEPVKFTVIPKNPPFDYRYKMDNTISTYLNRAVKNKKLDKFFTDGKYVSFYFEKEFIPELLTVINSSGLDHEIKTEI